MKYQKTLLSVLIANALTIPAAIQANEIEIYGTVSSAIESLDNDVTRTLNVSNNHSALGVKGSTAVNNNVKGVFLFDTFVGMDDSGSGAGASLFGR